MERKRCNAAEQVRHKKEPKDPNITWLPAEDEEGNVEYKLRLKDPGAARLEQLVRTCITLWNDAVHPVLESSIPSAHSDSVCVIYTLQ